MKYSEVQIYLDSNKDLKYRHFHAKLLKNDEIKVIGVRTPILKKLAKKVSKQNYLEFISENKHLSYEDNVIHGLLLGYLDVPQDELFKLIDEFIPYIDNWAVNDLTAANLKAFKHIDIKYIDKYLISDNPWEIRFGLTLLLNYYINEENLDKIFKICDSIKDEFYYVQMANAWLLSMCYIKYKDKTYNYLKTCKLDKFTLNKTISKICDSYRVSKEDKELIKKLRMK